MVFNAAFLSVVVEVECPVEVVGLVGVSAGEEGDVESVGLES